MPDTKTLPQARLSRLPGPALRWTGGVMLVVAILVTAFGWAIASPIAGSPDDDFHLGSAWCPRPVSSSGCETTVIDGEVRIIVPEIVSNKTTCYVFNSDESAACQNAMSDEKMTDSSRYDDGNYPIGYYHFHHLLVTDNEVFSVLVMRMVNVGIAVLLLGLIGVAIPAGMRRAYLLTMVLAWMPMGLYFIASNNPSSWSLTGVFAYAAGLYTSVRATGRQRWILLGLALVGALLSYTSRGDAAFFIFVVSLAVLVGVRWSRQMWVQAGVAGVASVIGAWIMTTTGQSRAVSSEPPPTLSFREALRTNITSLPEYFAGFYGRRLGAGWFDVPFDGAITIIALCLAGAALLLGVRTMTWRKALSVLVVSGAIAGIPVVMSLQLGFMRTYQYQPRYMLPLLAVFFFISFVMGAREPLISRHQAILIAVMSVLVQLFALHTVLLRYTHGIDNPDHPLFNLNHQIEWWWNTPVSPMAVWLLSSVAYSMVLVLGFLLTQAQPDEPEDVEIEAARAKAVKTVMAVECTDATESAESAETVDATETTGAAETT